MKKLSPKFVTFRNAPVTYVNAETNVEETRSVPQIVFSLEKGIDLGDGTERKTLYFFLNQWRKAFHEIGAGAYLQEMDKRFGDDVPKHQDAFNRLSQACTWSVDLNDDGYPAIVGIELPEPIKAAAAKFKAARDAEMAAFGIQVVYHIQQLLLLSLLHWLAIVPAFVFSPKARMFLKHKLNRFCLKQMRNRFRLLILRLSEQSEKQYATLLPLVLTQQDIMVVKNLLLVILQAISGTMKCSVISARTNYFNYRYVAPIMGQQMASKIKKCINGEVSANEARVQVPTLYKAIRNNRPNSWTSLVAER